MNEPGQRFRAVRDIPVVVMTAWASPSSGGRDGTIRAGTTFTVRGDPSRGATAVYCEPDDARRLERELVPLRDRARFWSYRGFYLCVDVATIRADCEPADE